MAFEPSPGVKMIGENLEQSESRKRLCIGLNNIAGPGFPYQAHWASSEISPEKPFYDASRYDDSNTVNVQALQAFSGSTVDLDYVSQQRVANNIWGQTLFQNYQNALSPSPVHHSQHSWLDVVKATTPSEYHQVPDIQPPLHPTLNACEFPYPPSSATSLQPTSTSNTQHGGDPPDQRHQSDVDATYLHEGQLLTSEGAARLQKSGDTGHADTSYELCFGLVGQARHEVYEHSCVLWGRLLAFEHTLTISKINTATFRVSSTTLETIPAGHSAVKLNIQSSLTTVHFVHKKSDGDYMGLLDHETASALGQIRQENDVDIRAYILHDRKSDSKSGRLVWGASIPINIVVYGHAQDSELVGESLSEHNIFLQHPQYKEDLALYKNPQYLVRPGEEYPDIECMETEPSSLWTEPSDERGILSENRLESVFEAAQGPETYSNVEPSPRIRTNLQPHQRKGLAMMREKESGDLQKNDFIALWSQTSTSNGRSWYRNCVTGSVKENPVLCLGGLLADEMGLGKSLTVIALIAGTVDAMVRQSAEQCLDSSSSQPEQCNKTTLIVTPKSTLHSWKEQFATHTNYGSIQVCYYSGNKRKSTMPALLGYDVVVTTYGTLTAERNRRVKQSCDEDQPLLANHWLRVVLDEAHVIRNASTKQCAAVCALKARHRWSLTGTPIQNTVEDFGTLLQFLRVYPFDNASSFTHEIADWIRCGDQKGMKRLRLLVSAICLRRTKDCLGLPPRKNETQPVDFNSEEKHLYEICKRSTIEFIELVFKEDGRLNSFATVIQLILRLRQICNHGKEMLSTKTLKNIDDFMSSQGSKGLTSSPVEIALCGICGRKVQDIDSLLPCMHPACSSCCEEKEIMVSKGELECSICASTNSPDSNNDLRMEQPMPDAMTVDYKPSSKVAMLVQNLLSYNENSLNVPIKR